MDVEFKQKHLKTILELSRKHNFSVDQVIKMYKSQFQLVEHLISEDSVKPISERRTVKLQGLGSFKFLPYLAHKLTEQKRQKDERKIFSESSSQDGDGAKSD
jgi:hypothetical protein